MLYIFAVSSFPPGEKENTAAGSGTARWDYTVPDCVVPSVVTTDKDRENFRQLQS